MTKTVVITRAKGDEETLTEALHELGMRTIHEALTEIFLNHTARAELTQAIIDDPDGIIVTSRHGARALAALTELRDPSILCVGESAVDAALSAGFTRVAFAGGKVEELIAYLADAYDSDARFTYVSAKHVRTDIEPLLAAYQMQANRIVAYEALAAKSLSDTLTEQLKRGQIDAITFLSQRSAQIFCNLLAKTDASDALSSLHAICISEAVAEPLRDLGWQGIHTASKPTLASVVECVDNALNR